MNAITPYQKTKDLLRSPEVRSRFEEILGDHAQSFLASVLSIVSQDNKLSQCDPNSIVISAIKAATFELPIEPQLGQSCIVAYGGKDGYKAQFQIMWKGYIQLAHRTENYTHLNVTEVYEGEEIKENRLTGAIVLNGSRKSDKIVGYCGYFRLKNGFEKYLYMTVGELDAFGKRYSKSYNYDSSPWKTHTDDMYRKTVLKQLLSKYGQLNISGILKTAMQEDTDDSVVDSPSVKFVDEVPPEPEPEEKTKAKRQTKAKEQPEQPPEPEEPPTVTEQPKATQPEVPAQQRAPMAMELVARGYFESEVMAKTALRFYTGDWELEKVEPWAAMVSRLILQGESLSVAANIASEQLHSKP